MAGSPLFTASPVRAWGRRGRRAAAAALLVLLAVGGCTRILLSQLDTLAVWYVDGYVDLTAGQERLVRDAVGRNLAWFRQEELPKYVALLGTISRDVEGPVSPALVARRYRETELLWDELRTRLTPDVADFARSLSDEQVEDFFAALAEDNADLAEEYSGATPGERRHRQDRLILKNLRRMVGRLGKDQEAAVLARTARLHDLSEEWLGRRQAWQGALREALARRREADFAGRLRGLIMDTRQFDSATYRRQVAENQQEVFAMLAELATGFTPRQRTHFRKRLDEFSRDMTALATQPPPPTTGTHGG